MEPQRQRIHIDVDPLLKQRFYDAVPQGLAKHLLRKFFEDIIILTNEGGKGAIAHILEGDISLTKAYKDFRERYDKIEGEGQDEEEN